MTDYEPCTKKCESCGEPAAVNHLPSYDGGPDYWLCSPCNRKRINAMDEGAKEAMVMWERNNIREKP